MKVTVVYDVMKMLTPSVIEIDESTDLVNMKERIYQDFWEKYGFSPYSCVEPHGSAEHITLVERNITTNRSISILNDDDFQERIRQIESPIFEVSFVHHL